MKHAKSIAIAAATVTAVALFAGGWKASDIHHAHTRGTLAQRQHCAVIAKRFQRDEQEGFTLSDNVALVEAGYSGSLDTCVATVELMPIKSDHPTQISVRDSINGKMFFLTLCDHMPCTEDDQEKLLERAHAEFTKLVVE
jgi:hypothetical protein